MGRLHDKFDGLTDPSIPRWTSIALHQRSPDLANLSIAPHSLELLNKIVGNQTIKRDSKVHRIPRSIGRESRPIDGKVKLNNMAGWKSQDNA